MDRDKDVEILRRPVVYDGYAKVEEIHLRHRLHAGGWSPPLSREMVERGHAVGVMPFDPARDEVVLIRQFRIGAWGAGDGDPWLVETIAGIVEDGETAKDVARREAMEEAGCEIGVLLPVSRYFASPGMLTERIDVFIGLADTAGVGGIHGLDHEGEDIEAFVMKLDDALAALAADRIQDAKAIICLQWIALNRAALRRRHGKEAGAA